MSLRTFPAVLFALILPGPPAMAEVGVSPFAGFRISSSVDIETAGASVDDQIHFRDSLSKGLTLNFDLAEPGKQVEVYFSQQSTSVRLDNGLFAPGIESIDLSIYQLQLGGLYFPGGKTTEGLPPACWALPAWNQRTRDSIATTGQLCRSVAAISFFSPINCA